MAAFSYKDITPARELEYRELLRRLGIMFIRYRMRAWEGFASKPLNKQFEIWWAAKGPTGFRTTEDSTRFKRELLDSIVALMEESNGSDESGNSNDSGK